MVDHDDELLLVQNKLTSSDIEMLREFDKEQEKQMYDKYAKDIYVIVGPSGVGKDTVAADVLKSDDKLRYVISATTRDPREGETNKDYIFLKVCSFKQIIEANGFIEYCEVHGNYYGTLKSSVSSIISSGDKPLLIVDVHGFDKIKKIFPNAKGIFIDPPSMEELETRLRSRGTETEGSIQRRLINAKIEIDYSKEQDYALRVVNDTIEACVEEINKFINPALYHQ